MLNIVLALFVFVGCLFLCGCDDSAEMRAKSQEDVMYYAQQREMARQCYDCVGIQSND